jgi:peptide deformylase
MAPTDAPAPIDPFIGELKRWRDVRGFSQSALAKAVRYTPSYVSKVESGSQKPSGEFAENADRVLNAGGALLRVFRESESQRAESIPVQRHGQDRVATNSDGQPLSLLVEHEDSSLYYDGSVYRATQRRQIFNASEDPIARYLIRISVDRYPGNPERSNQLYRENPLTWEELGLTASIEGEPIGWRVQHDRDAFKELWLKFENECGRYPVYPGETAWIEYSYTVTDIKWGNWYQRAIRLPTRRLSVTLDFPAELDPVVWGTETTMTAEAFPFRTAIRQHTQADRRIYAWSTDDPPLHARYRLEWKFRARPEQDAAGESTVKASASETMAALGVIQDGDPILSRIARTFDLPAEAEDARRVVAELNSAAGRVASAHTFGKGMGIAAPQIGIDRAAAIVRTVQGETITLLNPRVIDESAESDEQYEGCLSFFDVRGMVPRPLALQVEHQDIDGKRQITFFESGLARLVAHEVDHLYGVLYRARMRPGVEPIPISEYKGTGQSWIY